MHDKADVGLQDAMDLAYLTGQRVTDTRLMDERDVRDGQIWVLQGKTKAKRRIEVTGELKVLIDRIMSRKSEHKVRSTRLIVTEDGTPMTVAMLRRRFDLAREAAGVAKSEFQMRDLRAKAGTDKAESSGDIMQARDQLGHTTVVMTEQYIRNRIGKKVTPTK
ncbi:site-specific tyrosine recombinase XerC [compost metagenome]